MKVKIIPSFNHDQSYSRGRAIYVLDPTRNEIYNGHHSFLPSKMLAAKSPISAIIILRYEMRKGLYAENCLNVFSSNRISLHCTRVRWKHRIEFRFNYFQHIYLMN